VAHDERRLQVLRAIVQDYVSTNDPVGSKALAERHDLGVSPATIRNDMAVLEEQGYITQPHTSAGRVPTDKGYRLFVDRLSPLGHREGLDRRQPVDEQPVALVRGHAAGTGVRLGDVTLLLEHRHVVADGGAGHPERVALDQCLGPHRFPAGDVVGHDGAQYLQLAVVHRVSLPCVASQGCWHSAQQSASLAEWTTPSPCPG